MTQPLANARDRAQAIADCFAALPQVRVVALAGSSITRAADAHSDLDIYVYCDAPLPHDARAEAARTFAGEGHPSIELDKPYWGPEDAWIDAQSGLSIDLVYWSPDWVAEQVDRVLVHHQGQVGFSTAFWHTVQHSLPLFDRDGWFAALQERAAQPYPEPLRRHVLRMNYPVLRQSGSSYRHQLELAILRRDRVSVNHRIAALLASYFDILFAVNRLPQPGEKRLVALAEQQCASLPEQMAADVDALLCAAADPWDAHTALARVDVLLDHLDRWLVAEELLTAGGALA